MFSRLEVLWYDRQGKKCVTKNCRFSKFFTQSVISGKIITPPLLLHPDYALGMGNLQPEFINKPIVNGLTEQHAIREKIFLYIMQVKKKGTELFSQSRTLKAHIKITAPVC